MLLAIAGFEVRQRLHRISTYVYFGVFLVLAAFFILASILAHGLTDTVGARWIDRRMQRA